MKTHWDLSEKERSELMSAMKTEPRDHRIDIRVSKTEVRMLRAIAAATGLSISDWVRQKIRNAAIELRAVRA